MKEQKNILDHIKIKPVDQPSDDFFKDLAEKTISAKVNKTNKAKIVSIVFSLAALLILALIMYMPDSKPISGSPKTIPLSEIKTKEIRDYIEQDPLFDNSETIQEDTTKKVTTPSSDLKRTISELEENEILLFFEEQGINPYESEEEEVIRIF